MNSKSTTSVPTSQPLAPPQLHRNEQTRSLYFYKDGIKQPFKNITPPHFTILLNQLSANIPARTLLSKFPFSVTRKVELYTFFSLKHPDLKSN